MGCEGLGEGLTQRCMESPAEVISSAQDKVLTALLKLPMNPQAELNEDTCRAEAGRLSRFGSNEPVYNEFRDKSFVWVRVRTDVRADLPTYILSSIHSYI